MSLAYPSLLILGLLVAAALIVGAVLAGRRRSAALAAAGVSVAVRRNNQLGLWLSIGGVVLLAVAVGAFVASGSSLVNLIGANAPQPDEFEIRRVEFEPGEIRVRVTNPQQEDLTIASLAVDDAIPDHPSVGWRKRHFPKVMPTYFVNSLQIAAEMVGTGLGVGILPLLMAQERRDLVPLRDLQDANQSELWLLTHPESRHLRRIAVVYGHLAQTLRLP